MTDDDLPCCLDGVALPDVLPATCTSLSCLARDLRASRDWPEARASLTKNDRHVYAMIAVVVVVVVVVLIIVLQRALFAAPHHAPYYRGDHYHDHHRDHYHHYDYHDHYDHRRPSPGPLRAYRWPGEAGGRRVYS